jgi:hypothetical protein
MPSLSILGEEITAALAAQERHGDALDSKAGILLGFAGVLVGLSVANLRGNVAHAGAASAAAAALCAGAAFVPRTFPALAPLRLRNSYLTAQEEFTRLRLLDTRIVLYQETESVLRKKAALVTAAAVLLGIGVILMVIGSML